MGTHRSKVAVAQPSGVSWVEIQFSQDLFVSRTKSGLSGDDYQFNPNVGLGYAGTFPDYSAIASVIQSRDFASPQSFPEGARPLVSRHFYDFFGSAQQFWLKVHAWRLDWLYIRVTHHCIRALAPWKTEDTQVTGVLF